MKKARLLKPNPADGRLILPPKKRGVLENLWVVGLIINFLFYYKII